MANGVHGEKRLTGLGTLACLTGVAALAALWAAAWGYREGHWDYGFALSTISRYAGCAGLGAVVVGLIGLGASLPGGARRGAVVSLVGIVAGGAAAGLIGERYDTVRTSPFIHDISTDLEDPPAFLALLERRSAEGARNPPEHPGAEAALQQRAGYPPRPTPRRRRRAGGDLRTRACPRRGQRLGDRRRRPRRVAGRGRRHQPLL